ncbi:MAG: molybdopterin-binding/glycosyltransferase family 2 protein [Rhodospirillaceae bacterium]|nr:molybdopterin-binding/glycosyltransferase family 2 protein [Rhodospirillaceae bacterium]
MKFGSFPIADAAGVILAHTTRAGNVVLKKGHVITSADITALKTADVNEVIGARLETGDVLEDAAAGKIAELLAGRNVTLSAARTGRCNVLAAADGVVQVSAEAITTANLIDESITIATLPNKQAAKAGQIVATVKIIPFAVTADVMARVSAALGKGAMALAPFAAKKFAMISTITPSLKASVIASTEDITRLRIAALGGETISATRTGHTAGEVAKEVKAALGAGADVILVVGASATVDRGDMVPAGIVAAGGVIDHFGMPVDPGNLLVLAHVKDVPVLVLPGCARSPKLNGVDWVMQRLAAGITVTARDIMAMGVGGLLVDTPSRPLPRKAAVEAPPALAPKVAAILLAAGQSRRMGPSNKLLMEVEGEPLVRRTVSALRASPVSQVIVVTGHQDAEVRKALAGLDVTMVHNPRYAEGLSTSLKTGLDALAPETDAAVIGLGDMPGVKAEHVTRLMARFDPEADRAIGVPTHNGKRGNPVLWARRFFEDMFAISGDVGAKALIGANESLVYEIEFGDTAVLTDLDTPEQWADYLGTGRPVR